MPLHWHGGKLSSQPRRPAAAANASQFRIDRRSDSSAAAAGGRVWGSGGQDRKNCTKWMKAGWMVAAETSRKQQPESPSARTVFGLARKSHILRFNRQHGKHCGNCQQRYQLHAPPHHCKLPPAQQGMGRPVASGKTVRVAS